MASTDVGRYAVNAGEVSRFVLAHVDLKKLQVACEKQENWLPTVSGPAMMRPGTQYIVGVPGDAQGWLGEFYFNETQTTLLVMTAAGLQFLVADAFIARGAVSAVIRNGGFDTDLTDWTVNDESGATSSWVAGTMSLVGTGTNYAFRDQQITVTETGAEHALRVVVLHGTVTLKVGTVLSDNSYIDAELLPGTYSLAFKPTGNFWLRFGARTDYPSFVDSIAVESAGVVSLPVPYSTKAHFDALRYDQSGDVIFLASAAFQQRRIERRAADSRSWGIALYRADDGPFRLSNTSSTTIAPSATVGSVTLTASRDIFKSGHVGGLFRLTHPSQTEQATLGALNDVTGNIRVTGLASHNGSASSRSFTVIVDGTFVGTVTLQRSLALPGSWSDVESYTTPTSKTFDDGLDNNIIYYRLKMTAYTSGTAPSQLLYSASAQTGIGRITSVSGGTTAIADVLSQFGGTTGTDDWAEGEWSDSRGWPAAVILHDGRLFWGTALKAQGSVSDAFASFDDTVEGDSGPLNKTITAGGLDGIRWFLSLQRLLAGSSSTITSIRSSAFDEPLTPTQFVARVCADDGAAALRAIRLGKGGFYVGASRRLYKLLYELQQGDYESSPVDRLKPEMCAAGIADIAVQRKPDNAHIWLPLNDGSAVLVAEEQKEDVEAMVPITTQGSFERVAVLPASVEDNVYFIVKRVVNGVTKRFIEKLARRTEAAGGQLSKTSDCHVVYSGAATTVITVAHLEGNSVVVWADGAPLDGMFTVSGGVITLPNAASNVVAGLGYTASLKTAKMAFGAEHGTGLTMQKRIAGVGLVMADVSWKGVRIGRDFVTLQALPATYRGHVLTASQVLAAYDARPSCFNGRWDSDSRVCIQISSPHCCTLMGLVAHEVTNSAADEPPAPRQG